jgi:hypothetical protein
VPSILGDQRGGDHRLGRQPALDQPFGRRRLHHRLLAGPGGQINEALSGRNTAERRFYTSLRLSFDLNELDGVLFNRETNINYGNVLTR